MFKQLRARRLRKQEQRVAALLFVAEHPELMALGLSLNTVSGEVRRQLYSLPLR